jgi:2-keto-4-pentenoate hydratase
MLGKGDHVMTASPQIEALAENPGWVCDLRTTLYSTTKRIDGCTLADGHVAGAAIAARPTRVGQRHIVGQKIAITYRASWDRIGIDQAVWPPVHEVLAFAHLTIPLRCGGEDVATRGAEVLGGSGDAVHEVLASRAATPIRAGT